MDAKNLSTPSLLLPIPSSAPSTIFSSASLFFFSSFSHQGMLLGSLNLVFLPLAPTERDGQQLNFRFLSYLELPNQFLKKKDPTNQPKLSILLAKQITKCCMISEHYHVCTNEVRPKFVTSKHHSKHLLLNCCIIQLSFIQFLACIVYGPKQFVSLLS